MEWHNETIDQKLYRKILLEKVVPAIKSKWPRGEWSNNQVVVRIQQDGPNSHIVPDDAEWVQGLEDLGVGNKIILYNQPPNLPDLNINDLGLFRALDAAYRATTPRSVDDILENVKQTY